MKLLNCSFGFLALGSLSLVVGESIEQVFKRTEVVPDVVPEPPHYVIRVVYSNCTKVNKGNKLTPTEVKDEPFVSYDADPKKFYALVMVDPDVPSRADRSLGEVRHWIVGNIPGDNIAAGETLAEYIGSAPPEGSGYHRYVFFIYKQPKYICFDEPRLNNTSRANRMMFSVYSFSLKYDLGRPVAGNLYLAQYDPYVDVINAILDGN